MVLSVLRMGFYPIVDFVYFLLFNGSGNSTVMGNSTEYGGLDMDMMSTMMPSDSPEEEAARRGLFGRIIVSLAYTALAVSGITGNTLVIYAVLREPGLQVKNQLSNMAIVNLALTDFCTTSIVCIPGAIAVLIDYYPFHSLVCRFCTWINVSTIEATMITLSLISVDRFIAVKWSLHYPTWVTQTRMALGCAVVWTWSLIIGGAYVVNVDWITFDYWAGVCDVKWAQVSDLRFGLEYGVFCTVFAFVVPSSIIFLLNAGIIRMSRDKGGRTGKVQDKSKEGKKEDDTSKKVLKSMMVVILTYLLLNIPVGLVRVVAITGGEKGPYRYIPHWYSTVSCLIQFSASVVNPFIYGLFRKDFKDAYFKIWKNLAHKIGISN